MPRATINPNVGIANGPRWRKGIGEEGGGSARHMLRRLGGPVGLGVARSVERLAGRCWVGRFVLERDSLWWRWVGIGVRWRGRERWNARRLGRLGGRGGGGGAAKG